MVAAPRLFLLVALHPTKLLQRPGRHLIGHTDNRIAGHRGSSVAVPGLRRCDHAVVQRPDGWGVDGDPFVSADRTLAEQVAAELDSRDPLPCEHQWDEITNFTRREPRYVCPWCSKMAWQSELP